MSIWMTPNHPPSVLTILYTTPSSTCVHVFISGKLGLKPISDKMLGLKLERAKVDLAARILLFHSSPVGPREILGIGHQFPYSNMYSRQGYTPKIPPAARTIPQTENKHILKRNKQCTATPPLRVFLCSFWKSWDLSFRHGIFWYLGTYGLSTVRVSARKGGCWKRLLCSP